VWPNPPRLVRVIFGAPGGVTWLDDVWVGIWSLFVAMVGAAVYLTPLRDVDGAGLAMAILFWSIPFGAMPGLAIFGCYRWWRHRADRRAENAAKRAFEERRNRALAPKRLSDGLRYGRGPAHERAVLLIAGASVMVPAVGLALALALSGVPDGPSSLPMVAVLIVGLGLLVREWLRCRRALPRLAETSDWFSRRTAQLTPDELTAMGRILGEDPYSFFLAFRLEVGALSAVPDPYTSPFERRAVRSMWMTHAPARFGYPVDPEDDEGRSGIVAVGIAVTACWLQASLPIELFDRMTAPWLSVVGDLPGPDVFPRANVLA
jgi:hypothetical protein